MKTALTAALLGVGLILTSSAQGEKPDAEAKKFEGTWQAVSITVDGKEMAKEDAEKSVLTVKGDHYTLKAGTATIEGTHKLDPSKTPKAIDATRSAGPDKGKTIHGIYELTDDSYKVCFAEVGKDRPTEFSAKAGSGNRLIVMKRQKP